MIRTLLFIIICAFPLQGVLAQDSEAPQVPTGLKVKADANLADTARIAHADPRMNKLFSVLFTEDEFVNVMCVTSGLNEAGCKEARDKAWSAPFPEAVLRVLRKFIADEMQIRTLEERALAAEGATSALEEELASSSASNETLRADLASAGRTLEESRNANATLAVLLESTNITLQERSVEAAKTQAALEAALQAERRAHSKQTEMYVRYAEITGVVVVLVLTLVLATLILRRRKLEKTRAIPTPTAIKAARPSGTMLPIRLQRDDEVPERLRDKCVSVSRRYDNMDIMLLEQAKARKGRKLEVLVPYGDGKTTPVECGSSKLWKLLSRDDVETAIRENWNSHFPEQRSRKAA